MAKVLLNENPAMVPSCAQYEQAGLMIRCSSWYWLKTGVKYEPESPTASEWW